MMVIDVEKWRESKVAANAIAYLKRFSDRVFFWDQQGLNAVLAGLWTSIDPRWNWSANLDRLGSTDGTHKRILHFNGQIKPWVVRERMKFDAQFFNVLDSTAWRGWRPQVTLKRAALAWYGSSLLRRTIYPAEHWGVRLLWRITQRRT
jgi:lipopolysaccharide biosynthesis glycosyltransferase